MRKIEKEGKRMQNKSGYDTTEELSESNLLKSLPVSEQETQILWMRDEAFADIYTSDTTQMTRLDKLCADKKSSKYYSLIEDTGRGKIYRCADKTLVWGFRTSKKEMSDEAKQAASDRFKQMWADKRD